MRGYLEAEEWDCEKGDVSVNRGALLLGEHVEAFDGSESESHRQIQRHHRAHNAVKIVARDHGR